MDGGAYPCGQVEVVQALLHDVDVAVLLVGFLLEVVLYRAAESVPDAVRHALSPRGLVAGFAWSCLAPLQAQRAFVHGHGQHQESQAV